MSKLVSSSSSVRSSSGALEFYCLFKTLVWMLKYTQGGEEGGDLSASFIESLVRTISHSKPVLNGANIKRTIFGATAFPSILAVTIPGRNCRGNLLKKSRLSHVYPDTHSHSTPFSRISSMSHLALVLSCLFQLDAFGGGYGYQYDLPPIPSPRFCFWAAASATR